MRPKPPRKKSGPHNPGDDRLLYQLWKALRIDDPHMTVRAFADIAMKNYYPGKKAKPGTPANITRDGIVRHLNRLREKWDK